MGVAKQFADASKARLASLENRLSGIMKPIAPRREFVNGLNRRIQTVPQPAIIDRVGHIHFTLLIIAGVLSLGVLFAMLMRFLFGPRRSGPRQA